MFCLALKSWNIVLGGLIIYFLVKFHWKILLSLKGQLGWAIYDFFAWSNVKPWIWIQIYLPTTKVYNLVVPVRFPNIIVVSSILIVPFPLPLSSYVIEENKIYPYSKSLWNVSNFTNSNLSYLGFKRSNFFHKFSLNRRTNDIIPIKKLSPCIK